MAHSKHQKPLDFIVPLNMNGLQGRMLHLPATKTQQREILVIYGHHAMLERWWGLAQNLNAYGSVTMPDLPGFGGMDSFRKIGVEPTIDAFADYLASFIKFRYKRRRLTIVGISYGFVIVTRMLQRYPDLAKKVDILVSAVGFAHHEDFAFSSTRKFTYRSLSRFISTPLIAGLFRLACLNRTVLRLAYHRTYNARHKFKTAANNLLAFNAMMDMEIRLWHTNDVRTHMKTTAEFLQLDNCRQQIPLTVWHIYSDNDHYFNNSVVEQHFRVIFKEVHLTEANLNSHITSVIANKRAAGRLLPKALREAFAGTTIPS